MKRTRPAKWECIDNFLCSPRKIFTKFAPSQRKRAAGFSLPELLVGVAVFGVLAGVAVPAVSHGRQNAHSVACLNNLRQIGTLALVFAAENQMTLPQTSHQQASWQITLQQYSDDTRFAASGNSGKVVFRCPSDRVKRAASYAINDLFMQPTPPANPPPGFVLPPDYSRLSRVKTASQTFLFAEANAAGSDHFHFSTYRNHNVPLQIFSRAVAVDRHRSGANYLFADGHVEHLSWREVTSRLSDSTSAFVHPNRNL